MEICHICQDAPAVLVLEERDDSGVYREKLKACRSCAKKLDGSVH